MLPFNGNSMTSGEGTNLYHTLLGHGGQGGETYTSRWTKGLCKKCEQDIFCPIGYSKFLKYK